MRANIIIIYENVKIYPLFLPDVMPLSSFLAHFNKCSLQFRYSKSQTTFPFFCVVQHKNRNIRLKNLEKKK